ncbi:MAG: acyl-CoA synthetase FdrA [Clostridiaceae bacterium]
MELRKNAYFDSVTLMRVSGDLKKLPGVVEALVGMGTPLNLELAANLGLGGEGFSSVGANDLFIALRVEDENAYKNALLTLDALLSETAKKREAAYFPPTLEGALRADGALNMALISVPGRYAAGVAQKCLYNGLNVMLFSDNVTVEEELKLKTYAAERGLLVMGPDCGTAIINGVPLAFSNAVRRGRIGMVCASGTGAQEVSSIIDTLGEGVSQLIGTGGRDLKKEIGGIMMKLGIEALGADPETEVIVLVSKPPAREIAEEVLKLAAKTGKKTVVCFIGGDPALISSYGLVPALSLEDAAHKAVALLKNAEPKDFMGFSMGADAALALAKKENARMAPSQRFVRGYYTGGTLCDEAMKLLYAPLGRIFSNIPLYPDDAIADARGRSPAGHTFLDFGDDAFTAGRPHPMIDPSLRAARVLTEGDDPETALVLVDCVIGYGSHDDPADELAEAILKAKARAERAGRYLSAVAGVCGAQNDPQSLQKTRARLEEAGAVVLPSNAQAARFSALVMRQREACP